MRPVPASASTFVAGHEGLRLVAYLDQGGVWTVGYGHTGPEVKDGLKITQAKARKLLEADLVIASSRLHAVVKREVIDDLTENQYVALLSFVFNLGANKKWTLWRRLNARQFDQVPVELMRFTYVGKIKVRGLVNRRAAEFALWSTDEPGSVDEEPGSAATRRDETPPVHRDPKPLFKSSSFVATAATGVTGASVGISEVSHAINPYADQSEVIGRVAGVLAAITAMLAVAALVFVWLKRRQDAR